MKVLAMVSTFRKRESRRGKALKALSSHYTMAFYRLQAKKKLVFTLLLSLLTRSTCMHSTTRNEWVRERSTFWWEQIGKCLRSTKGRWRVLMKRIDVRLEDVVAASCVLHNICEAHGETFDDELLDNSFRSTCNSHVEVVQDRQSDAEAIRNALMVHFSEE